MYRPCGLRFSKGGQQEPLSKSLYSWYMIIDKMKTNNASIWIVIRPGDRIINLFNDLCLHYNIFHCWMLCSTVGTGGKEASLFTQEMFIMYQRWVTRTTTVVRVLSSWAKLFPFWAHLFLRQFSSVANGNWTLHLLGNSRKYIHTPTTDSFHINPLP